MLHIVGQGVVGQRAATMLRQTPFAQHAGRTIGSPADNDVAILAHGGPQVDQAQRLLRSGVNVVAIGDQPDDVNDLISLETMARRQRRALVIGAAASPGLAGLLARWTSGEFASVDEIHVAVHGTAGRACARQHHQSMSGRTISLQGGQWVESLAGTGRELCWFPEPVGAVDCYRSRSAEPELLHRVFPEVARLTHRRSARRRDRFTARFPMLSPPPAEGGIGGLRVELRGADHTGARHTSVVGVAEYSGTSAAATGVAFAVLIDSGRIGPGMWIPGDERLPTLGLLHEVTRAGVRLQEFTGTPQ